MSVPSEPLLELDEVTKWFPIKRGLLRKKVSWLRAVDGISLDVQRGSTLGIVGESGCGKSTLARLIVRLLDVSSGSISFDGEDVTDVKGQRLRRLRRRIQFVMQDPYASLDPRMSAEELIAEPLVVHGARGGIQDRVGDVMSRVGLDPSLRERLPHEFSGGQRQRIAIARAIVVTPELIVLDEPASALDVSIQAQILNLLLDLQEDLDLTYVLISHDLSVVKHVCDEIAVMYLGRVVERASNDQLFESPAHPYTVSLLSAVPVLDPSIERARMRLPLRGEVPSQADPPSGCRFHPRCYKFLPEVSGEPRVPGSHLPDGSDISMCSRVDPALVERSTGHGVACHFPEGSSAMLSHLRSGRRA